MALDLSKYLNVSMDDIPDRVKPLPTGHYIARIRSWKGGERQYDKDQPNKKTPVVELTFVVQEACEDIEAEDLPESGGAGKMVTRDYRLDDPDKTGQTALRRVATHACDLDVKGLELEDVLDALKGQDVKLFVETPNNEDDPDAPRFPRVKRVLPVNEDA